MSNSKQKTPDTIRLPIKELPLGNIIYTMEPEHPNWKILDGWDTPQCVRGGHRRNAYVDRVEHDGKPCLEWLRGDATDQSFVTGEKYWRNYSVKCQIQPLQAVSGITNDDALRNARAGLILRMETSRCFYTCCIENQRRMVIYRRMDDEWFPLAECPFDSMDKIVTLEAEADGDTIYFRCPELDLEIQATDTLISSGHVGFRALGSCRLFELEVQVTPKQKQGNQARCPAPVKITQPDAEKVAELNLANDRVLLTSTDFYQKDRNDLLWHTPAGLVAETWDGEELWRLDDATALCEFSPWLKDGSRRIYALSGCRSVETRETVRGFDMTRPIADELVAVDSTNGKVINKTKLPEFANEDDLRFVDFGVDTGRLFGGEPVDVVVRNWRKSLWGAGEDIWAYDGNLKQRWYARVWPPYGHHNAIHFFDVNGDGKDEIVAGGVLLSPDGETIWIHDQADEMLAHPYGFHYDAIQVGNYTDDQAKNPVVFMAGGSAGLYVVDAKTGKTTAIHHTGHTQWVLECKMRDDLPGKQVLSGTRWGNFGIISLFSGHGERLWTIQPDFIGEGSKPVQWLPDGPQHLWHNTSPEAMGLYDGYGKLVQPLEAIRELITGKYQCQTQVLKRKPDGTDLLGVQVDQTLHLFGVKK